MALMEVNFFSKALMRPVTMNVILPADKVFFGEETEEENKPFKTLYLLHGVMGNYTDWVTGTCIKRWAEEKNLAVVMPSGANMFYMDHPNANENYSEFIGKELVKITRRMFPLSHKKEDTFIAGLSMGGYGAIRNGLKYHDTFGYIAGLSSAMILEKMGTADDSSPMFFEKKSFLESVFGDLSRIKDCEINPEWIAENMKKDGISHVIRILFTRYAVTISFATIAFFCLPFPLQIRQALVLAFLSPIASACPAYTDALGEDYELSSTINSISMLISIGLITAALIVML